MSFNSKNKTDKKTDKMIIEFIHCLEESRVESEVAGFFAFSYIQMIGYFRLG